MIYEKMFFMQDAMGLWKLTALMLKHLASKNASFLSKMYEDRLYGGLIVLKNTSSARWTENKVLISIYRLKMWVLLRKPCKNLYFSHCTAAAGKISNMTEIRFMFSLMLHEEASYTYRQYNNLCFLQKAFAINFNFPHFTIAWITF